MHFIPSNSGCSVNSEWSSRSTWSDAGLCFVFVWFLWTKWVKQLSIPQNASVSPPVDSSADCCSTTQKKSSQHSGRCVCSDSCILMNWSVRAHGWCVSWHWKQWVWVLWRVSLAAAVCCSAVCLDEVRIICPQVPELKVTSSQLFSLKSLLVYSDMKQRTAEIKQHI